MHKALELYQEAVVTEFTRELNFYLEVSAGRSARKADFTDQLIALGQGWLLDSLSNIPIPGANVLPILAKGAIDKINKARHVSRDAHAEVTAYTIDQEQLRIMLEIVALKVAECYQFWMTQGLSEKEVRLFAKVAVERMLGYLLEHKLPLSEDVLLKGVMVGPSGRFVSTYQNQKLSVRRVALGSKTRPFFNRDDYTAEGAYERSGLRTPDGRLWIFTRPDKNIRRQIQKAAFQATAFAWEYGVTNLINRQDPKYGYISVSRTMLESIFGQPLTAIECQAEADLSVELRELLRAYQPIWVTITREELDHYLKTTTSAVSLLAFCQTYKKMPNVQRIFYNTDNPADRDLSTLNLEGHDFSCCVFDHVQFGGSLNNTQWCNSFLRHADFTQVVSATHADFTAAHLEFLNARGGVDFSGSNLTQAQLHYADLSGATLTGCTTTGAIWNHANLTGTTGDNLAEIVQSQARCADELVSLQAAQVDQEERLDNIGKRQGFFDSRLIESTSMLNSLARELLYTVRIIIIDQRVTNAEVNKLIFQAVQKIEDKRYIINIGGVSKPVEEIAEIGDIIPLTTGLVTETTFKGASVAKESGVKKRIMDGVAAFKDKTIGVVWCLASDKNANPADLRDFLTVAKGKLSAIHGPSKIIMADTKHQALFEYLNLPNGSSKKSQNKWQYLPNITVDLPWAEIHQKITTLNPNRTDEMAQEMGVIRHEMLSMRNSFNQYLEDRDSLKSRHLAEVLQETQKTVEERLNAQLQQLLIDRQALQKEIEAINQQLNLHNTQHQAKAQQELVEKQQQLQTEVAALVQTDLEIRQELKQIRAEMAYDEETKKQLQQRAERDIAHLQRLHTDLQRQTEAVSSYQARLHSEIQQLETKRDTLKHHVAQQTEQIQHLYQEASAKMVQLLEVVLACETVQAKLLKTARHSAEQSVLYQTRADLLKKVQLNAEQLKTTYVQLRQQVRALQREHITLDNLNLSPALQQVVSQLLDDPLATTVKIEVNDRFPVTSAGITELIEVLQLCPEKIGQLHIENVPVQLQAMAGLATLFLHPDLALTDLNLENTGLDDATIQPLLASLVERPGQLRCLKLSRNQLAAESALLLGQLLANSEHLQYLYLGFNQLRDDGAQALAKGLCMSAPSSHIPRKIYLTINGNHIQALGIEALVRALLSNPVLTEAFYGSLWWTHNPIGDRGVEVLQPWLLQAKNTYFNFENCQLQDGGVVLLCNTLLQRSDRQGISLHLNHNSFTDKALIALSTVYQQQPYRLRSLSFSNSISAASALPALVEHYVSAVLSGQDLTLSLSNCGITADILQRILPLLARIPKRDRLYFSGNQLADAGLAVLCEFLEQQSDFAQQLTSINLDFNDIHHLDGRLIKLITDNKLPKLKNLSFWFNWQLSTEDQDKIAMLQRWLIGNRSGPMPDGLSASNALDSTAKEAALDKRSFLVTKEAGIAPAKVSTSVAPKDAVDPAVAVIESSNPHRIVVDAQGSCVLSNRGLSDDAVAQIVTALFTQTVPLQSLNLSHNQLTGVGLAQLITQYFMLHPERIAHLKALDLSDNPLTDQAQDALILLLRHPQCQLERLSLQTTGLTALAPLFPYLKSVKQLDLAGNVFTTLPLAQHDLASSDLPFLSHTQPVGTVPRNTEGDECNGVDLM